jgi:hypothetical protein
LFFLSSTGLKGPQYTRPVVEHWEWGKKEILQALTERDKMFPGALVACGLYTRLKTYRERYSAKDSKQAKSKATREALTAAFDRTDIILKSELDSLMEAVREKNPAFYNEYWASRVIKDLGFGHKNGDDQAAPPAPTPEPEAKAEARPEAEPEAKAEARPEAKAETKAEVKQ